MDHSRRSLLGGRFQVPRRKGSFECTCIHLWLGSIDADRYLHSQLYVDNLDTLRALESPVYKLSAYINMFMMRFFNHGLSKAIENVCGLHRLVSFRCS